MKIMRTKLFLWVSLMAVCFSLFSCLGGAPKNVENGCSIFEEKWGWYKHANNSYKRWGVPIHVLLAIIRQESSFVDDAKAPRDKILWVIPWFRKSSAYGYAQATNGTWASYVRYTGNRGADRDDFGDAIDFVGWYVNQSHRQLGLSKWDAYNQYLAYHEGQAGYKEKTYIKKKWLMKVAKRVKASAARYRAQLARCKDRLENNWWLWPF